MVFSDFSLLMATLWCSLFMLLLFYFRSRRHILELSGIAPLLILIIGTVLRCFIPIDIPHFTRALQFEGWLAELDTSLRTPVIQDRITPLSIIFGVWLLGTLIALVTTICSYATHMRKLRSFLPTDDPDLLNIVEGIADELHVPMPTVCLIMPGKSPSISGLFHPIILIPIDIYEEKDLRYIFYHELMHWKERDIWIKLLISLLCCVFWWNPCSYLLKLDLSETLEMRCDQSVSRLLTDDEKHEYVDVLKKTFNSLPTKEKGSRFRLFSFGISEFAAGPEEHTAYKRADLVLNTPYQQKYNRIIPVVTLIITIAVFIFSYSFIIQPHYDAPEDDIVPNSSAWEFSQENAYIVENTDGTYSLYIDDMLFGSLDAKTAEMLLKDGFKLESPK